MTFLWVAALWFLTSLFHALDLLRFLQIEEYDSTRFLSWCLQNWTRIIRPFDLCVFLILQALILLRTAETPMVILACLALLPTLWQTWLRSKKGIKPLIFTPRALRLSSAVIVLLAGLAYIIPLTKLGWVSLFFFGQFNFFLLILANLLLYPVEALIRRYYLNAARKVLARVHPFVIGITGSYGKSSTKEILAHLLSTRYSTLKTPKSYNTLMGVCKVIREELKPHHQYFIVEMGAYKKGEIAPNLRIGQTSNGYPDRHRPPTPGTVLKPSKTLPPPSLN